jgi:putative endonuclease
VLTKEYYSEGIILINILYKEDLLAKNNEIGLRGENLACEFLVTKGYEIVARNWRFKRAEVDIIAKLGDIYVFIEVKAKTYDYYGDPSESITQRKEDFLIDAATQYCIEIGHGWEVRFDIISIIFHPNYSNSLNHYIDAFFPGI